MENIFYQGAQFGFGTRGNALAKAWYTQLGTDDDLQQRYAKVGPKYAKQAEFRRSWAEERAEEMKHERVNREQQTNDVSEIGEYLTKAQIVVNEADSEAAQNYCTHCKDSDDGGVRFMGWRLLRWDDARKRFQYLYVKDTLRSKFTEMWSETTRRTEVPVVKCPPSMALYAPRQQSAFRNLEGGPAGSGPETPRATQATDTETASPASTAGARTAGGAGGEAPAVGAAAAATVPEPLPEGKPPKPARVKTELDKNLGKARALKIKWMSVSAEASALLSLVDAHDEWTWAKPATVLTRCLDNVLAFKTRNDFWRNWFVEEVHALRKRFAATELAESIKVLHELETAIESLALEVACLKSMAAGRRTTMAQMKDKKADKDKLEKSEDVDKKVTEKKSGGRTKAAAGKGKGSKGGSDPE